jgi:hypothetical protein
MLVQVNVLARAFPEGAPHLEPAVSVQPVTHLSMHCRDGDGADWISLDTPNSENYTRANFLELYGLHLLLCSVYLLGR